MKIRNGFVSNSSSSSFCMVGVSAYSMGDNSEFVKKLKPYQYHNNSNLDIYVDCECSYRGYIGRDVQNMGMSETRGDFYKRVLAELREFGETYNIDELKTLQLSELEMFNETVYN